MVHSDEERMIGVDGYIRELIAAVEQAQAVEASAKDNYWKYQNVTTDELIRRLEAAQAELVEANKWKGVWKSRCKYAIEYMRLRKEEIDNLRKQLAETRDKVKRLRGSLMGIRDNTTMLGAQTRKIDKTIDEAVNDRQQ